MRVEGSTVIAMSRESTDVYRLFFVGLEGARGMSIRPFGPRGSAGKSRRPARTAVVVEHVPGLEAVQVEGKDVVDVPFRVQDDDELRRQQIDPR